MLFGWVVIERQQNNVSYLSIEIRTGIRKVDVAQPNILVPLLKVAPKPIAF